LSLFVSNNTDFLAICTYSATSESFPFSIPRTASDLFDKNAPVTRCEISREALWRTYRIDLIMDTLREY